MPVSAIAIPLASVRVETGFGTAADIHHCLHVAWPCSHANQVHALWDYSGILSNVLELHEHRNPAVDITVGDFHAQAALVQPLSFREAVERD